MNTSSDMPLVLYVEDEDDNFVIAELRLRGRFRVVRAATDREACDVVRHHAPELRAVLMDLQLKGAELDGFQLTRLFAGEPVGKPLPAFAQGLPRLGVPVFAVSAYGAALPAGGDLSLAASLFPKPIDYRRLIKTLQSLPRVTAPTAPAGC